MVLFPRFWCWLLGHKRTISSIDRYEVSFIYCSRCGEWLEWVE